MLTQRTRASEALVAEWHPHHLVGRGTEEKMSSRTDEADTVGGLIHPDVPQVGPRHPGPEETKGPSLPAWAESGPQRTEVQLNPGQTLGLASESQETPRDNGTR